MRLRQLGLRGEDAATLLRAIHAGLVLPILDGFDEIAVHLPLGERGGLSTNCGGSPVRAGGP